MGELQKADNAIQRCIETYKQYAPGHTGLAFAYINEGTNYYARGDYTKAIEFHEKGLELVRRLLGDQDINVFITGNKLGMDYRRIGDYIKAKDLLVKGYAGEKKYHPKATDSLSTNAVELGQIQRFLGDKDEAERLLKEGIQLSLEIFDENNINIYWAKIRLGQFCLDIGQLEQAKTILESCLVAYQKEYSSIPEKMAWVQHPLAILYTCLGEKDKAFMYFTKAESFYKERYGREHIDYAIFEKDFGLYYLLTRDYEKAMSMFVHALDVLSKAQHIEKYRCLEYIGDLYRQQERYDQASTNYRAALDVIKNVFPENSFHKKRIQTKMQNYQSNTKRG